MNYTEFQSDRDFREGYCAAAGRFLAGEKTEVLARLYPRDKRPTTGFGRGVQQAYTDWEAQHATI